MNQPNAASRPILALILLLVVALSCTMGQEEQQTTLFDQYYRIDPATLIDSLKNGDMNAFTAVTEEPEPLPEDQQLPMNWLEGDYFYIANTLYDGVLGKSLQDWELKSMNFNLECSRVANGFQNGRLEFFKVVKEKDQESRISRFIDIDPRGNFIRAKEEKYDPKLVDWKMIDMEHLKISADEALQIAEKNGGQATRQSVGNACHIFLGLFPNASHYRGWEVTYFSDDGLDSFLSFQIDPRTGEILSP